MSSTNETLTAGGYDAGACFDEAFDPDGSPRPHYRDVLDHLGGTDLRALGERVRDLVDGRGVAFGGEDGHRFAVDPVPRILTGAEWDELAHGLGQRVRALDAFLEDVYGDQRAVAEGIVPEHVVSGSSYFEKDLVGIHRRAGARIGLAGLDVVRDSQGTFRVLEDNVRVPSGVAYALAAAEVVDEVLPVRRSAGGGQQDGAQQQIVTALRGVLEASAPDVDGDLFVLTDGEQNSAWFEHRRLAELAGLHVTTPGDLRRRGDRLETADGRRVRAMYRRTEENRVRDEHGDLTPLAALLIEPLAAGEVGMVNWFGNGVADDKNVYMYVDDLVRFYLDEEPRIRSVPTHDLTDPACLEDVLDRLPELVVKPRSGQGGEGVLVGPSATPEELQRARRALRENPEAWIAQDTVQLSTHPTVVGGQLEPRHVDLRPFVFFDGTRTTVPEAGLTRVALQEGSMVVNSSQDGGGKATWVLR